MSDFIPNSFQIPNVLVDDLMPHLTPREFTCLVTIIRKTRGWHKQHDYISITQFAKITQTKDKRTLYQALDTLEFCGLVNVHKSRGRINDYSLGEVFHNPPEGEPVTKNRTTELVAKIVTTLGTKNATTSGESSSKKCTPTKDMNTKYRTRDPEIVKNAITHAIKNRAPLRSKRSDLSVEIKPIIKNARSDLSVEIKPIFKVKSARQKTTEVGSALGVIRGRREKFAVFANRVQIAHSRSQFDVGV